MFEPRVWKRFLESFPFRVKRVSRPITVRDLSNRRVAVPVANWRLRASVRSAPTKRGWRNAVGALDDEKRVPGAMERPPPKLPRGADWNAGAAACAGAGCAAMAKPPPPPPP